MKKRKRQFWFNVLVGFICILFMVIIAVQAISNLYNGKFAGGFRYDWQPLGPGIQLVALATMLFALAAWAWQHARGKNK